MRRRRPEKRTILKDPIYNDLTVAKFVNYIMKDGKKSVAEKILYTSLDIIKDFMKDHRVFMTSVVAALTFGGEWFIKDKESINTSFPTFLKKMNNLGAKII